MSPWRRRLMGLLGYLLLPWVMGDDMSAEPTAYRLVRHQGRLMIESSRGESLPWTCYGVSSEKQFSTWATKQQVFLDAGVKLYQLCIWPKDGEYFAQPFWSLDGQPVRTPRGPMTLGEQAEWLLERQPEARFFVRFGIHPDPAWRRERPEHFAPLRGKSPENDTLSVMPSLASQAWLEGIAALLRDTLAWCEAQPWRDRIVGYSLFPYGEGATEVGFRGELFDTSPVMQAAFRAHVSAKYADDAALQAAWQDSTATLATVTVPTVEEWQAKRQRLKLLHWPEPAKVRRERDYFDLQMALFHSFWTRVFDEMVALTKARPVLKGYDILKQPMLGWLHDPSFSGIWMPDTLNNYGCALLASGSLGVAPLLAHPGIDLVQTPGGYDARAVGYAWEAEGLTDSLGLRDKLNFMEADMRTWVTRDWRGNPTPLLNADAGNLLTPAEMRAGFDRTLAWALSRNQAYYYMSVWSANWWYDEPVIGAHLARQHQQLTASLGEPWRETRDAICLVLDDLSPLDEGFSAGFQHLAVRRQLEEGLALAGVPYRIHLLADLEHPRMPRYKCYLFPNLFRVTPETVAMLRRTVLRDGNLAIFGPGTGLTDGQKLSPEGASALLGLKMELLPRPTARRVLLQDHGHPISKRLPTMAYGDQHAFGPTLVPKQFPLPKDSGATLLGATFYHYFLDRAGLLVREVGQGARGAGGADRGPDDYAVVFAPAVPLPPELLRECARHGGAHVWSEDNAVIYASDSFVSLHSVRSGPQKIHLPWPARVRSLVKGTPSPEAPTRVIDLDLQAPATASFWLERADQPPAP